MGRIVEGDKPQQPEPGQPETITITLGEYRLLTDVADTIGKMSRALDEFKKPKTPVGFQFQQSNSNPKSSDSEPES